MIRSFGFAWCGSNVVVSFILAIVLLLMSMVHTEVVPLHLALMLVLGANIGNVIATVDVVLKILHRQPVFLPEIWLCGWSGCLLFWWLFRFGSLTLNFLGMMTPGLLWIFTWHSILFWGFYFFRFSVLSLGLTKAIPDKSVMRMIKCFIPISGWSCSGYAHCGIGRMLRVRFCVLRIWQTRCCNWFGRRSKNEASIVEKFVRADENVDILYKALKSYLVKITGETMNDIEGKTAFSDFDFCDQYWTCWGYYWSQSSRFGRKKSAIRLIFLRLERLSWIICSSWFWTVSVWRRQCLFLVMCGWLASWLRIRLLRKPSVRLPSVTWFGYKGVPKPSQPAICTWILSRLCGGLTPWWSRLPYPILMMQANFTDLFN